MSATINFFLQKPRIQRCLCAYYRTGVEPNKELKVCIHDLVEEMIFLLHAWKGEESASKRNPRETRSLIFPRVTNQALFIYNADLNIFVCCAKTSQTRFAVLRDTTNQTKWQLSGAQT